MNTDVIEKLEDLKTTLNNTIKNELISFKLGDIDFYGGKLLVGENNISQKALSKICKTMKVYDSFLDYKRQMTDEDWTYLQNKLIDLNSKVIFWGKKNNVNMIDKVYSREEIVDYNSDLIKIDYTKYIDMIIDSLDVSNHEFYIKNIYYDNYFDKVYLNFINKNSNIDVFGNNTDMWKRGVDINFDLTSFKGSPFFERLACSNGMTTEEHGYKVNIQNKRWNLPDIQKQINRLLIGRQHSYDTIISNQAAALANNNVSVKEFYDFLSFVEDRNENEKYSHILNTVFSENDIMKFYGTDPKQKSPKWQASANSGRNAYDFFNDMTYLASHIDKSRLEDKDARDLAIKSSSLFFKKTLDLQDIAPSIDFNVKKTFQD